ncbi:MAG: hypothetical protein ACR2FU_24260 [Streptosporangiaceae bacterium]
MRGVQGVRGGRGGGGGVGGGVAAAVAQCRRPATLAAASSILAAGIRPDLTASTRAVLTAR